MKRALTSVVIAITLFVLPAAQASETGYGAAIHQTNWDSTPGSIVGYHLFSCANHTYGYEITLNGKVLIHQAYIPCVPGKKGFASEQDAAVVANLVAAKVRKGILPPTITIGEMQSLGVHL